MSERMMTTYTDSGGRERFMDVDLPVMTVDLDAWEAELDRLEDNARRFATLNDLAAPGERGEADE